MVCWQRHFAVNAVMVQVILFGLCPISEISSELVMPDDLDDGGSMNRFERAAAPDDICGTVGSGSEPPNNETGPQGNVDSNNDCSPHPNFGATSDSSPMLLVSAPLYVGCALAILLLLGTVTFFLSLRKELFTKPPNFVHLNISFALLLSFLLYCIAIHGGGGTLNRGACEALSFFLHWFSLVPACWTLCESLLIANTLLWKPVSEKILLMVLSALGWVPPLVIALISIASGPSNYLITVEDKILGCWLPAQNGIYWAFAVPIILSIIVFAVLLLVIAGLWCRVHHWGIIELSSTEEWDLLKTNAKLTGTSCLILVIYIITFVLGLATLNAPTASNALSYLFCIASTILVITVVILYVVFNDKDYGDMKQKTAEAIKAYCFGSHKKGRSRGPVEGFPMRTMHVQWQAERAPPNVYGDPDPNETADVGDEESNLQEKGEQITLE